MDIFPLKTPSFQGKFKLGWVAFHSLTFELKCLDFQSNQYKKHAPVKALLMAMSLNILKKKDKNKMVPQLFSERDEYFCRRENSSDVWTIKLRVKASFSIF